MSINFDDKKQALVEYFKELGRVAIAFSGGTDSSLLLMLAKEAVGAENVLAITAKSCLVPQREIDEANAFCLEHRIEHLSIDANVLDINEVKYNAPNRCYACKHSLFRGIIYLAKAKGYNAVCEGSNADDLNDYRPGFKAVTELGVRSPLLECGIAKADVRKMLNEYNLPIWQKPSFACLASRFVYGEEITEHKLKMVENAEQFLFNLGLAQFRVRIHNDLARIEVDENDFSLVLNHKEEIYSAFKQYGFNYISLDLKGYRTGSMNEVL